MPFGIEDEKIDFPVVTIESDGVEMYTMGKLSENLNVLVLGTVDYADLINYFKVYEISDVLGFLEENPSAYQALKLLSRKIANLFEGDEVGLLLEGDPDEEDSEELSLVIYTRKEPGEAIARMDDLDNWYLVNVNQNEITVHTEYV